MKEQDIISYYDESLPHYRLLWHADSARTLHYGYWDNQVRSHEESLVRLNEVIASRLKLTKSDLVLDAGCGLGGTSFWIAQHVGSQVVGVSITPDQIERAQWYARDHRLADRVQFRVMDYTKTGFPDRHFDAVVAIETICHLTDKRPFFDEMSRILKRGGRLAVADFTLRKQNLSSLEKNLMARWLTGWAVPNIWTKHEHLTAMRNAGFTNSTATDYSDKTVPSSKRLYYFSFPGIPLGWSTYVLGLTSRIQWQNILSARYQWLAKKSGLWGHFLYYGEKP